MKIFLLEDEFLLQEIIKDFLEQEGHSVVASSDGESAEDILYEHRFDILILDVDVPKINGFDVLKKLRKELVMTPAIYITALNDIKSVKNGFESGCDDYMKKPFELDELLLRVNSIKKRGYTSSSNMINIGDNLYFDIQNERLYKGDIKVELHTKELKLLKILLKNKNKVVSSTELIFELWENSDNVNNTTLRTHIKNLRKAIGVDKIKNIRNGGYIIE